MDKNQQQYFTEASIDHKNTCNMFNDGTYKTPKPHISKWFSSDDAQAVEYDFEMSLLYLESYFKDNKIQDAQFYQYYEEYIQDKIEIDKNSLQDFLQQLINNKKLTGDKKLYEDIMKFLNYAVSNNMLHKKKYEFYKEQLTKVLFLNNENKVKIDYSSKYKELDYSEYKVNNFRINNNNSILNALFEQDGAIFMTKSGKISMKLSKNDKFDSYSKKEAEVLLKLKLKSSVKITEEDINDDEINIESISIYGLILVMGTIFKPYTLEEYLYQDGAYYRNIFKPSKYLMLTGKPYRQPTAILDLIFNLVDYNNERYHYLLNWLSFFFQYLKKSQVAIALIGDQGTGKGILFSIISKLFGEEYCITINDESLNSKYKAKLVEGKLFFNLDEIKFNTSKKNDSFIKALITNPSVSVEEKNVTMEKEIELYGQCLFSSNNLKAIYLDESDRRYTIFNTGNSLPKIDSLGFGRFENIEIAIDDEMEDFAKYLKNFNVDIALANTALDTPEKQMIINASKDNLKDFHAAIVDKKIIYFDELSETNIPLYTNLYSNFNKNRIDRADITKAYNALFSGRDISTKELLSKLREIQPYDTFTKDNMIHSGNAHFYKLP